jgi:hypothetical protein
MFQKGTSILANIFPKIIVIFMSIKPVKKSKQQKILTLSLSFGPTKVF